jgi:hypothetical protein
MFPINPLEILLNPAKYGAKAIGYSLVLIVPYVLWKAYEATLVSKAQKKSDTTAQADMKEESKVICSVEKDWLDKSKEVDKERNKNN